MKKSENKYHSDSDENENKYFLDEKGSIIKNKNQERKKITRENSNSSSNSKAFTVKYIRESKSLEFSINIGNSESKEKGCFSQLKFMSFYQALFAEILGTYLLVMYICSMGLPVSDPTHKDTPASINGCLGSGLVVASLVWGLAHVSGANLNPAVTVALFVTGETNLIRALFYIPCQILGSILAVLTLKELVPDHINNPLITVNSEDSLRQAVNNSIIGKIKRDAPDLLNLNSSLPSSRNLDPNGLSIAPIQIGLTLVHQSITPIQGMAIEAILTFILVLTVFACIDSRRKDLTGSFPLTIGFAVAIGGLFGGQFTGASMNPARSLGPAVIMNNWTHHWVYWAGPILGAVVAAFTYKILLFRKNHLVKS